ncbi:MAG: acetyltransferase [Muribaculaceae bacterium]|nr:acetyltransferase [Muribaculaceae bacterium]
MVVNKIANIYSFKDKIKLIKDYIATKVLYRNQRIIRNPFIIRGRKMIKFGNNLTTGIGCRLEAFVADGDSSIKLNMGDNIQFNDYVHISAIRSVEIGNDVLIASHVYISDNSHGSYKGDLNDSSPDIVPIQRPYFVAPVKIGDRVWLGEGVIIMPGSEIGDGSIVGAHSIVSGIVPTNSIVAGSPARIIKIWDNTKKKWLKC